MFRIIYRHLPVHIKSKTNEPMNFFDKDVAYESEYYYRQDRELLKILKEKTEEEVKAMQKEVRTMHGKIEEYNRDISETLRFLKSLESDPVEDDTKES